MEMKCCCKDMKTGQLILEACLLKVKITPFFYLKQIKSVSFAFTEKAVPVAASSRLNRRDSAGAGVLPERGRSST